MIAGKLITLTIDGRSVQAQPGQTVLDAAAGAGIKIPSLCHHGNLPPIGACRLCLVEIEQQRTLQPSCTFPAADGLVVHTQSPKVIAARLMSLQLLFSERSHYCMVCPMSGTGETTDCELQKLGYDCGMAAWPYPPDTSHPWPIDASHPYLVMDQSRCVLCRRCVRACDLIAASHTLGVQQRGPRAMIGADDGVPLGDSSCISCGVCAQLCPTGALTDRRSAFASHDSQATRVTSACMGCSVACGIDAVTRDDQLLRIDGDWQSASAGLLCADGRYKAIEPPAGRIVRPLVRTDGQLRPASWDDALAVLADRLKGARAAGLISSRLPTESLAAFVCLFQECLASNEVGLLSGDAPPLDVGQAASLEDVADADCLVVIGGDPLVSHKVVGYLARRAFDRGAQIMVIDDATTALDPYARQHLHLEELSAHAESPFARLHITYHLRMGGLKQLKAAVAAAERPVVIYGHGLSATVYAALRGLPERVCFLPLVIGTNTRGAARLGLAARAVEGQVLYALLGDETPAEAPPPAGFRIVQASFASPWTDAADVVLPARAWAEQSGHITDLTGRIRTVRALLDPPAGIRPDGEVLLELARRLGCSLALDEIPGVPTVAVTQEQAP